MSEFGIGGIISGSGQDIPEAVMAVKQGACGFALCNDFFGINRRHAAESGLCYIHPTYGTVSRFGLVPSVCSMDNIGIVCKNPLEGFGLLSDFAGKDDRDSVMFPDKHYYYDRPREKPVIAVAETVSDAAGPEAREGILDFAGIFDNITIFPEFFNLYKQVMYILSCAELSGNLSRYDGVKFGHRADTYRDINNLYAKTRTESFGFDVKLALIMGSLILSKDNYIPLYEKAMRLRRRIKDSLSFDGYDIVVLPSRIGGGGYENLALAGFTSLTGMPSLSFNYKGHGIQLIAAAKNEAALLAAYKEVTAV